MAVRENPLSHDGQQFRQTLAEHGIEVTPSELAEAIDEALERIGGGTCSVCGRNTELRYGMCFVCAMTGDK